VSSIADEWLRKYQDEKYFRVYDFAPPLSRDNFLEKIPVTPGMAKSIDVLANLGRGLNIIELALGLRRYYPDINPDEVLSILRNFELRKFVQITHVKPGIGAIAEVRKIVSCPLCKSNLIISLDLSKLDFSKGVASMSIIHGDPPHAVVIYIDREGKIRGIEAHKDVVFLRE